MLPRVLPVRATGQRRRGRERARARRAGRRRRDGDRRPARAPRGLARVAHPLADRRARRGPDGAQADLRGRLAPAGRARPARARRRRTRSTPACARPPRSSSHFARKTGCGLLLPGDRRAVTIDPDLLAWPQAHVRLALIDDATGPGAVGRAEPPRARRLRGRARDRPAAARSRPDARRLPDRRPGRDRRAAARVLEVAGCQGFVAGRTGAAAAMAAVGGRRMSHAGRRSPRTGPGAGAVREAAAGGPLLPLWFARGSVLLAFCAFAGLHWARHARPGRARAPRGRRSASPRSSCSRCRPPRGCRARSRWLAATAVAVVAVALALLAGGLADEYLRPDRWERAARRLEPRPRGAAGRERALPRRRRVDAARARRRRHVARGGRGAARVLAAARTAPDSRPRRCSRSSTLYAVPAVVLSVEGEFLRGALLALLMLAFLRLEKLRVRDAPAAGAVARSPPRSAR